MVSEPVNGTALFDGHGRVVNDLRISLTDRCNFRCVYCMPAEGLAWTPTPELLTVDEILRLASLFISRATRTVRLTGGEPLVRRDIVAIVHGLRALHGDLDLSLTTNGFLLTRYASALAEAGMNRVNISIDSLEPERFASITRRDALAKVLEGVDAAIAAGLTPVKINTVMMKGVNDDEVRAFVRFARERAVRVRFIEFMPLDADKQWRDEDVVTGADLLATVQAAYPVTPLTTGHDPAVRFGFADGSLGEVGFINSVSEPFCERCNRVRLSADGQLRTCLFAETETDLRGPMRDGASDADLLALIQTALANKPAGHRINEPGFVRPGRSMSQIGG